MEIEIRPETSGDQDAIRHVNRIAFGGNVEPNLVDALRDGGFNVISLVAEVDRHVIGHIEFSPVSIVTKTSRVDALSLAPMAVLPKYQRRGIGSRLVRGGLEVCRQRGHRIVVVLGHPDYYPRFGFSSKLASSLESPFGGGEAWMALELVPGSLSDIEGKVEYSAPFNMIE